MTASLVCQVIDYRAPTGGSFIPALTHLSRAIAGHGDRFAVLASDIPGASWPSELAAAGAEVQLVRNGRDVAESLRRLRPHVVHSHFNRFDIEAALADHHARVFWHVHSHRERFSAVARARAFAKYGVVGRARVEAVITVSQAMQTECIQWFAPRDRVRVLYNGIDIEHFRPPTRQERDDARAALGIAPGEPVVLFFERVAYKGGAVVKRALQQLSGYRLIVVGGTREDRERFGDPPRVIAVERAADARRLYWAADVLAFASEREAFGLVLVEALACGIPIAASDIPVVHEICDGVENVRLFEVGNAQGLATAIEGALRYSSTSQGRVRALDRFSLDRWTGDMLELYRLG